VGLVLTIAYVAWSIVQIPATTAPITDKRMDEILASLDPEARRIATAPPLCWGYRRPGASQPERFTEREFQEFMNQRDVAFKRWSESLGADPPITCEAMLK
jgi:hypothetical protein